MEDKNTPPAKPLFSNPPTNRLQSIQEELINETSSEIPLETIKDIPYSTRSSRITTALLKLDDKQRTIVKAKTEGKTDKEALESAGYSPSYIRNEGKKLIEKPAIQSTLQIIMDNSGITDEFMVGKLKEGMDATRTIVVKGGKDKPDKIIESSDHSVRHKFIETGLKLKGHLDKKVDIVHHKSHEDQLRELQGGEIIDADYDEILPDA
jgi:DNA-binding CsgD family transcriptional regulator